VTAFAGRVETAGVFVDRSSVVKVPEAELVAALRRCVAESGLAELNQDRYARWRRSLPDRRVVPNPLAFGGDAASFVEFCAQHGVPCAQAAGTLLPVECLWLTVSFAGWLTASVMRYLSRIRCPGMNNGGVGAPKLASRFHLEERSVSVWGVGLQPLQIKSRRMFGT